MIQTYSLNSEAQSFFFLRRLLPKKLLRPWDSHHVTQLDYNEISHVTITITKLLYLIKDNNMILQRFSK